MKRILGILIFVFLFALPVHAQYIAQWTQGVMPLPAAPATCAPGNGSVYYNTTDNTLYNCTAANTWRPAGFTANQNVWAQGTITANAPVINHTVTWNNAAVTFDNFLSNVTNTASNVASQLLDLQVGGASMFYVRRDGLVYAAQNITTSGGFELGGTNNIEFSARSRIYSGADAQMNITDNAGTGFSTLTFGPETNAFIRVTPVSVGGVGQGVLIGHGDGTTVLFADLAAATNGTIVYCADCTKATPCAAAGNGALAKRLNGAWDCD